MYAKVQNGTANFVVDVSTQADVAKCFHPDWLSSQGGVDAWSEVPSGTQHGATDNGDGTFTNPTQATPLAATLSATAFNKHCWANLGGGTTGMARFQAIIDAAAASETGAIKAVHTQYVKSQTFDKSEVESMLGVISSLLQTGEADAILDNWP